MSEVTITIDGMSCQHCVMRVKKAIDSVNGVRSSEVEIGSAIVHYDDAKATLDEIKNAVSNAGYKIAG